VIHVGIGVSSVLAESLSDGARWVLFLVFVLAAVEKVSILRSGSARWHPMMLVSDRRRRHADLLIASSLTAETAVLVTLLVHATWGAIVAVSLIVIYTVAAQPTRRNRDAGCQCLWKILNPTKSSGLIARNAFLLGLSAVVYLVSPRLSLLSILWSVILLLLVGVVSHVGDWVSAADARFKPPAHESAHTSALEQEELALTRPVEGKANE
jgi:hypothetical protein